MSSLDLKPQHSYRLVRRCEIRCSFLQRCKNEPKRSRLRRIRPKARADLTAQPRRILQDRTGLNQRARNRPFGNLRAYVLDGDGPSRIDGSLSSRMPSFRHPSCCCHVRTSRLSLREDGRRKGTGRNIGERRHQFQEQFPGCMSLRRQGHGWWKPQMLEATDFSVPCR